MQSYANHWESIIVSGFGAVMLTPNEWHTRKKSPCLWETSLPDDITVTLQEFNGLLTVHLHKDVANRVAHCLARETPNAVVISIEREKAGVGLWWVTNVRKQQRY